MRSSVLVTAIVLLACGLLVPAAAEDAAPPRLTLHRDLPRDPLMVLGLWLEDPARDLESVLLLGGPIAGPGVLGAPVVPPAGAPPGPFAAIRAEVLASLGSEVVLWIDVRSIDDATLAFRVSPASGLASLLGQVGVVARVRDAGRLDRALRQFATGLGGKVEVTEGLVRLGVPLPAPAPESGAPAPAAAAEVDLFYRIREGRAALGFAREWVEAALAPRSEGQRLVDGEDWRAVFSELDPDPSDLVYINLPRLMRKVEASQLAQLLLRANPDVRAVADRFLTPEGLRMGVGSTSVRTGRGVRTRNFGPSWMSGTALSTGSLVALAAPQVALSIDRGRARRTALDVEAIAQACDRFSSTARAYPGPTEGFVPIERIAVQLEPVYIAELPRTDAWRNPILYWSDGGSYRVISTGRDGRMDQDWSAVVDPAPPGGPEGDIVFGDGRQIAAPEGLALSPGP